MDLPDQSILQRHILDIFSRHAEALSARFDADAASEIRLIAENATNQIILRITKDESTENLDRYIKTTELAIEKFSDSLFSSTNLMSYKTLGGSVYTVERNEILATKGIICPLWPIC